MQRPFFSQSPNRVGSGPEGPPISRGRGVGAEGGSCGSDASYAELGGVAVGAESG